MGDTTTPTIGLVKPEVGASRSTWGTKWNANADDIDAYFLTVQHEIQQLQTQVATLQNQMTTALAQGAPIGAVLPWMMFTSYPSGYLVCNGDWQNVATYPALFAILGAQYGGDGVNNFGLPDLRGCVLAGYDGGTGRLGGLLPGDYPGIIGGSALVGLTEAQMPSHQHTGYTDPEGDHDHGYTTYNLPGGAGFQVGSGAQFLATGARTDVNGAHQHYLTINFTGGGQGHPNLQVSCLVSWIIRAI